MEKTNYYDFLNEYDFVRIPKIQREYVQGQNERGYKFIKKIFEHLKDDKEMTLDLVYGKEENEIFEPIDGQQRLTTMFLLYWYIGKIEEISKSDTEFKVTLQKFTYDTRKSSKEFCEVLCDKGLSNEFSLSVKDIPSEIITNAGWYFVKYKYDYTVKSMLSMLDMIQKEYKTIVSEVPSQKLYKRLEKIIFYKYSMEDYERSEQLYVIMNDRGKKLTPYENLKSSLLGWLRDNNCEEKTWMDLSEKLDNIWTENLWKRIKSKTLKASYEIETDRRMYQFFLRYIWVNYTSLKIKIGEDNKEEIEKKIKEKNAAKVIREGKIEGEIVDEVDFEEYILPLLNRILKVRYKNNTETFCIKLTCYLNHLLGDVNRKDFTEKFLQSPWENRMVDIFEEKYTIADRVANYGLQLYVENKINDNGYIVGSADNDLMWKEWKRFVWNIIDATNAEESIENTEKAIEIIRKYEDCIDGIIQKLAKVSERDKLTNAEQFEIRKAEYILNNIKENSSWRDIFNEAEEHRYLRGYIDFLISKETAPDILEDDTKDSFKKRWENAKKIFQEPGKGAKYGGIKSDNGYLVIRALLSKVETIEADDYMSFCVNDTSKFVLKTAIKNYWQKYIKLFIFKEDMITEMEQSISDFSEIDDKGDDTIYWQQELCTNVSLVKWIQGRANEREQKASLMKTPKGLRIYFSNWNTAGAHIILDKQWHIWIEKIIKKEYKIQRPDAKDSKPLSYSNPPKSARPEYVLYFGNNGGKVRLKKDDEDVVHVETVDTEKLKVKGTVYRIDKATQSPVEFAELIIKELK